PDEPALDRGQVRNDGRGKNDGRADEQRVPVLARKCGSIRGRAARAGFVSTAFRFGSHARKGYYRRGKSLCQCGTDHRARIDLGATQPTPAKETAMTILILPLMMTLLVDSPAPAPSAAPASADALADAVMKA